MRIAALLALIMVLVAGAPTSPLPWWDLASTSVGTTSIARLALIALGTAGAMLVLRQQRLGKPLLIAFYMFQVPVVHLLEYAASAFVGTALYVTVSGGDTTFGAGLGSEVVLGTYQLVPYPPGIGINLLPLLGLALATARNSPPSGAGQGSVK
jgi:hypothetical protein